MSPNGWVLGGSPRIPQGSGVRESKARPRARPAALPVTLVMVATWWNITGGNQVENGFPWVSSMNTMPDIRGGEQVSGGGFA